MNTLVLPQAENIERYMAVVMSTGHLAPNDFEILDEMVELKRSSRVLKREHGYFIKLAGPAHQIDYDLITEASDELNRIIIWAKASGFSLIEFDSDASQVDGFTFFEAD